jgi:CBS domain-containing protein
MQTRDSFSGMPRIDRVMTPFPYAIELDRHVGDAQRIMTGRNIHHLPVTKESEVFSVLNMRDIDLALSLPRADPWRIEVREVCEQDPYIVDVSEPLDAVLTQMAERQLGCAVIAQDDRVAGIFTAVDACRCFAEWLRRSQTGSTGR